MRRHITLSCISLDGVVHQEKDPYWWLLWLTKSLTIHGSAGAPSCQATPAPRPGDWTPAAAQPSILSENGISDWEISKPAVRRMLGFSGLTRPAKQCS